MIEGFDHVGTDHKCNVCQCDFTDDEGGVQGYFGILPVAFCPTCFASMCDMVGQMDGREWEGLTDEELQPIADEYRILFGSCVKDFARTIESKFMEKNE